MRSTKVKKMIFTSILMAMAIVFKSYLSIPLGTFARPLSIWPIPLIMAGFICGLSYGIVAGLGTDLLYFAIHGGVFNPFFTISAIAWGVAGYLISKAKHQTIAVFGFIAAFSVFETAFNTLGMIAYGQEVISNLLFRIIMMAVRIPILSLVIEIIRNKKVIVAYDTNVTAKKNDIVACEKQ